MVLPKGRQDIIPKVIIPNIKVPNDINTQCDNETITNAKTPQEVIVTDFCLTLW